MPGDRIFLGKQVVEPKGIIAAGVAASPYFETEHWQDPTKRAIYNMVDFDTILDPESVLPRSELLNGALGRINWGGERGGITINDEAAAALEEKWQNWLDGIGFSLSVNAKIEDVIEASGEEGREKVRIHLTRERDSSIVRAKKLTVWNTLKKLACEVCAFDFAKQYGVHGEKYIECHHRTPLRDADRGQGRRTRLEDLALVCANCHRMLHRGTWPSMDELRSLLLMK